MTVLGEERPAWREVGGRVVERAAGGTALARLETLARTSADPIGWRFRQPAAALFWWGSGVHELRIAVDGRPFHDVVTATSSLCYIPPDTEVTGTFAVDGLCRYTVLFLDPDLAADHDLPAPRRVLVGFDRPPIVRALRELAQEAADPDETFALFVDGVARQSLAHLVRLTRDAAPEPPGAGLPAGTVARLDAHVRRNLRDPVTVGGLAAVAGFSPRHFLRSFRRSTGLTPMRWVLDLRLREAEHRLAGTSDPIGVIAAGCGFSHPQHLSTAFRRARGISPSEYRAAL
ncbi:helix-turn-helix domain-containing protein [Amycolatopsis sp. NPDC049252]|uniref:helix-turn-helix domain-containing protein n=1 Tax=Amycolatopsis sp. NPDC049252 TaxID=3363933 RepID=UPI003718ACB7